MTKETKNNDRIFIGKNCTIDSVSKIIGPVIIDDNCVIKSFAIIGPNVSIGKNSHLENCNIKNSIVMDNCIIDVSIKIIDSIIADETEIKKNEAEESVYLLGERSHLKL